MQYNVYVNRLKIVQAFYELVLRMGLFFCQHCKIVVRLRYYVGPLLMLYPLVFFYFLFIYFPYSMLVSNKI